MVGWETWRQRGVGRQAKRQTGEGADKGTGDKGMRRQEWVGTTTTTTTRYLDVYGCRKNLAGESAE
jgi:hypothetical protein